MIERPALRGLLPIPLAVALGLALPVAAQQQQPEEQPERARERAQALRETLTAASEAQLLVPLEPGQEVTWAEVMANPDDVTLNYQYAQTLIRRGDLRGAAATLERILLLRPDLPRARLLYAVVLFRLDSIEESERQFQRVQEYPLPERLAAEIDVYLREIELRRRRTRYFASATFGTAWDSNRNSAPHSGDVLFFGSRLRLDPDSRRQPDWSVFGLAQLRVEHDLGHEAGHELKGSLTYYASNQFDEDQFNLRNTSLDLGGVYRSDLADFELGFFGSHLVLSSETFFKNVGVELSFDRAVTPTIDLRGGVRFEWQDFDSIRNSETSNERTGYRLEYTLGAGFGLTPVQRLEVLASLVDKDARGSITPQTKDVFGYRGPAVRLRHTWLLGHGQFLVSTLGYAWRPYDRNDVRVSERNRRDQEYRVGTLYGAPLGLLLGALPLPEQVDDIVVAASADYLRVSSNITNYTYDNLRFGLTFTKSWSF